MKRKLLIPRVDTIALFPKNLRFITEHSFTHSQSYGIKIILTSAVSLYLLALIFLQAVAIWYNVQQRDVQAQQRVRLQNEVKYWEGIATKYQGYRDVYYRIAALQYKLGNIAESQKYVKKALELDPNFPEGHVLGAHVGLYLFFFFLFCGLFFFCTFCGFSFTNWCFSAFCSFTSDRCTFFTFDCFRFGLRLFYDRFNNLCYCLCRI